SFYIRQTESGFICLVKKNNMILRFYVLLFLHMVMLVSCDSNRGDQDIAQRERAVELREQRVALLENEYRALLKMRDSLNSRVLAKSDSTTTDRYNKWPERVEGDWNSRMVCRASRCANHVIGDQRDERWRFYAESTGMHVQVANHDRYVRVFEGNYEGEKIILRILNDSDLNTRIIRYVQIDDITPNVMKGTLVLTGKNNCEAVFSVELTPSPK